jgi:hypothetical protein
MLEKLPGSAAQALLEEIASWGELTTIVLHGGSVFEFKGAFPKGAVAEGYYNLHGPVPGLHGHLSLTQVDHIVFQGKKHRGRQAYAFNFQAKDGSNIFKVFLGRNAEGDLIPEQVEKFQQIRACGIGA